MAETADILANRPEKLAERGGERVTVVLPDMAAGCSMADMAAIDQVEAAWADMGEVIDTGDITPVTYINSAASLKAFCGRHGGIVCTSSNAAAVLRMVVRADQAGVVLSRSAPRPQHGPEDGHRATSKCRFGIRYNADLGGNTGSDLGTKQGHLMEGTLQRPPDVPPRARRSGFANAFRASRFWCIPECPQEVNDLADVSGSTGKIIKTVEAAPPGTKWAIGTELHLVNRLKQEHPEQEIHFLSPVVCMCATMYRIDLAHLCWSLENLAAGTPVNVIEVRRRNRALVARRARAHAASEIVHSPRTCPAYTPPKRTW